MIQCKACKHYHFWQALTTGNQHYVGKQYDIEIPCIPCSRFTTKPDNFEYNLKGSPEPSCKEDKDA